MKKPTRAERRARAVSRVKAPIPADLKAQDPLIHAEPSFAKKLGWVGGVVVLAGVLHVVALVSLGIAATVMRGAGPENTIDNEPIEIAVVKEEPPPPPPPPVEVEPEPEPEPEPEKPKPPPPKPPPKPKKAEPPPPDPIDVPKDAPPPPPPSDKPPPRRIVGLSLESTVGGGDGPAFAVGNTRMGATEKTAAEKTEVKELPKTNAPPPPPAKVNRRATRVPVANVKFVAPKYKKRVEPNYPEEYRAQNLEGIVTVQVTVREDGRTADVKILKPSPYPKFNDAALAAAKATLFEPATRGGKPVKHTLSFSYRFTFSD